MNAEMRVPADNRYFSMVIRIYIGGTFVSMTIISIL